MQLARHGAAVAHCPTSNAALGSGLFPLGSHLALGVRVALGSDVGAGTGFSLFKEGLQAYFVQQLLGREGHRLSAAHLLWLASSAGAEVLGLSDTVGDFSVGKEFDALWLRPSAGCTLDVALRHADSTDEAVAKAFALAGPADVAGTWVAGEPVHTLRRVASPHVADPGRRPRRDPSRAPPRGGGRRQRRPRGPGRGDPRGVRRAHRGVDGRLTVERSTKVATGLMPRRSRAMTWAGLCSPSLTLNVAFDGDCVRPHTVQHSAHLELVLAGVELGALDLVR